MKRERAVAAVLSILASLAFTVVSVRPAHGQTDEAGAGATEQGLASEGDVDRSVKEAMAERLLAERESETRRALDPAYRQMLRRRLASRSAKDLEAALEGGPLAPIPGGVSADLTYTPVTPCRIIDTRVAGGAIAGGTQRAFFVAGDFVGQGGNPGGCGVPYGPATAAMLNIAATGASGTGNLRAFAWESPTPPLPGASVLNYPPGSGAIANGIAIPICDAAPSCGSDLFIYSSATVHVVVDVVGYFSRPDANIVVDLVTKTTQTISTGSFTELLQSDIVLPDKCVGTADGWTVLVMASGYGALPSASSNARFGLSRNDAVNIQAGTLTVVDVADLQSFSAWHTQWVFTGLDAGTHNFRTLAATGGTGSYVATYSRMVVQVLGDSCP